MIGKIADVDANELFETDAGYGSAKWANNPNRRYLRKNAHFVKRDEDSYVGEFILALGTDGDNYKDVLIEALQFGVTQEFADCIKEYGQQGVSYINFYVG